MGKSTVPMREIWKARRMILDGWKVSEISERTGISSSTIRSYTKSERAKMKEREKVAK